LTDLSNSLAYIQVGLRTLADREVQKRLSAYFERVSQREGKLFRNLNELPEWAILNLERKIREELTGEF